MYITSSSTDASSSAALSPSTDIALKSRVRSTARAGSIDLWLAWHDIHIAYFLDMIVMNDMLILARQQCFSLPILHPSKSLRATTDNSQIAPVVVVVATSFEVLVGEVTEITTTATTTDMALLFIRVRSDVNPVAY
ncbi:uncharacterized protein A4U43_C07F15650 [Asparagus officinalis]|uniref:Uncharacterized protein n=1 Tax=Asparagus officinalis TaxID=4686 RepID=A0A5P1EC83_ASPOF|nr:uncharacterized protein A4U43_C07F15650 [Asparagus officinalis]